MSLDRFDALIGDIYGAVGRPQAWRDVLGAICLMTNSERAILYIQDLRANRLIFSATHNIDDDSVARFERDHLGSPISFPSTLSDAVPFASARNAMIGEDQMQGSRAYREVLAPLNIRWGTGGLVLRDDDAVGVIAAMRSAQAGVYEEQEEDILVRLLPHLSRAAQLHYRFLATELERAAAASVLDRISHAVVICDSQGRILTTNATARALMDARRGLRNVGGHLAGSTAAQSNALLAAISAISAGEQDNAALVLDVGDESFRVHVSPLAAELRVGLPAQPDLVLVSFNDPAADLAASAGVLKDMMQLTEAEARVALGLARGKTLEGMAEEFGVSLNTVRTHLAAAFAKTQTSRQAELVRLVLRTIGPFGLA